MDLTKSNVQAKEDIARLLARSDVRDVKIYLDELGVRWKVDIYFADKSGQLTVSAEDFHAACHRALTAVGETSQHGDCGHDAYYKTPHCAEMGCWNYVNKHNARV